MLKPNVNKSCHAENRGFAHALFSWDIPLWFFAKRQREVMIKFSILSRTRSLAVNLAVFVFGVKLYPYLVIV